MSALAKKLLNWTRLPFFLQIERESKESTKEDDPELSQAPGFAEGKVKVWFLEEHQLFDGLIYHARGNCLVGFQVPSGKEKCEQWTKCTLRITNQIVDWEINHFSIIALTIIFASFFTKHIQ